MALFFEKKLKNMEEHLKDVENQITLPEIINDRELYQKLTKELSELSDIITPYRKYKEIEKGLEEAEQMLSDKDPEMQQLADAEFHRLKEEESNMAQELEALLLPKDPHEDKSIFVEIRAGTGGEEAALFAGALFRMYLRYAENRRWTTELISENETGIGGYKEVVFAIYGKGAYGRLKYESGAHRVQRVPETEASGRIHTSAATVAVLPEVEDIEIEIEDKDLRIDTYRASGAGGQHVNKTSSAIRITHIPTGTVVACQDQRSQHQNKEKAMKILKTKIFDDMEQKQQKERMDARKIMVGSGDRSERVRTYNYPQGRVTDHRIGLTVYYLEKFLNGELDEVIDALAAADRIAKLEEARKNT